MPERRDADEGMVARQIGDIVLTKPSAEQFELIRGFMDGRAAIEPEDLFTFRVVGSSNGLDSYFTRQADSSLQNFVHGYAAGQSLMGSHATKEFSYGNSYNAELVDADPLARNYESAFYRRYADLPNIRATKWVVADYYMVRGISLNGQPTDDLIKAMEAGVVRKASVSFTVGQYRCGIDGAPMVEDFFGPMGDGESCHHFPGVEDKDAGIAWADMEDNDLLETSMVYKNASPGAMLLHKAEQMAQRGLLSTADIARIEERFATPLPRFERRVHQVKETFVPNEDVKKDEERAQDPPEDDTKVQPEDEQKEDEENKKDESPDTQAELDAANERIAAYAAREAALEEAYGEPLTPDVIRSLKATSASFDTLYGEMVDEAVRARVSVQADKFNVESYRRMLTRERDVTFVREERESYLAQKQELFKPGRQMQGAEVKRDVETGVGDGPNILAPRNEK